MNWGKSFTVCQIEPAPTINSELSSLLIDVNANESLIIVTTSPGAGQLIARVLDYHKSRLDILGTIAGDDTIFVAPKSHEAIQTLVKQIREMFF